MKINDIYLNILKILKNESNFIIKNVQTGGASINVIQPYLKNISDKSVLKYCNLVSIFCSIKELYNSDLLYNISDNLLECWDNFSKQSNKYSEGICEKYWKKMEYKDDGLGIGTLKYWAATDNMAEFKKIMYTQANEKIMDKEFGRHDDIALALKELYGYFYSCANIKKNTWFEYQKNRWVSIQDGYTLNNRISDDFLLEIVNLRTIMIQEMTAKRETDLLEKKLKLVAKLL
jgi:hypothetical protein